MKGRWIEYSAEELAFIEASKTLTRAELFIAFQEYFRRPDVSLNNIVSLCKRRGWLTGRDGRYPPGNPSHNAGCKGLRIPGSEKGWFRKGERSGRANQNYLPIGTEKQKDDGYLWRKIRDDGLMHRRWRQVHLIEWEAKNGPVPTGYVLKCLDGDRLNIEADNWTPVPKSTMPRLSGGRKRYLPYDSAPIELKPVLLATARLEHAAREIRKGGRS